MKQDDDWGETKRILEERFKPSTYGIPTYILNIQKQLDRIEKTLNENRARVNK
jgi:hypothetical protein